MKISTAAFTLLELLVVIAIIAVLASLAYAGAGSMIGRSQTVKCLSNMRQIGAAAQMFAAENNGRLPGTSHGVSWTNSLAAYLGPKFIGKCPGAPDNLARVAYGWNDSLADVGGNGIKLASCRTPNSTMAAAELSPDQTSEHFHFSGVRGGAARVTPNQFKSAVNVEAHERAANYLFVDGHAENLAWSAVQSRLTRVGTTFIVP